MSVTPLERVLLQRYLARRRHRSGAGLGLVGIVVAALVVSPTLALIAGGVGAGVAYASLADALQQDLEKIEGLHERALTETTHIFMPFSHI